jgi:ankyrin repeat protein
MLYWAASMGQTESAELLLHFGASADSLNSTQWTPLFWAAIKGHREMASLLISHNANVLQVDSDGMTPVYWSTFAGQNATTQLLLQAIEKLNIDSPNLNQKVTLRELKDPESLTISQAKKMVAQARKTTAAYNTPQSLVQLSAERLGSEGFSELI